MAATRPRKKKSKTKGASQRVAAPGLDRATQAAATIPTRPATQAASRRSADNGTGTADNGLFEGFLPHLIARLAYQLNADLIEKLRLEGINIARWRILAVLAMGDGITISEIIERAMMQQSALSRVLMTMESEEYVRRIPRSDDGRYVDVFLTEKGRALFDSLDTVVRRRQNRLLKGFSPQETEAAFALMRRLSRNLLE
jgi:MarR family transcriptional regulator, organic hydroperoxide resistance regulator